MEDALIKALPYISWPAAVTVMALVGKPIWSAVGDWIRRKMTTVPPTALEARLNELELFKVSAENNHWHDLDDLKEDRTLIWNAIQQIRTDFSNYKVSIENRLTRLESAINNRNRSRI